MSGDQARLVRAIGYAFRDPALLHRALTHRSAGRPDNERLEFLGDAVLGCVIAAELYRRFETADEGRLSRLRAQLVKRESLAEIARDLDLGACLVLGSGELKSGGHARDSILANALEAVLGAVYLEAGFEACGRVVATLFGSRLEAMRLEDTTKDPKSRLQEYLQARQQPLPEYALDAVDGQPHAQTFTIDCRVSGLPEAVHGTGSSRRRAEQAAAARALELLGGE